MKNNIYNIFKEDFPIRHFIRVGNNKYLSLYVGRDDDARYAMEFRGKFRPSRIPNSSVIDVKQYKNNEIYTLRFSLEKRELLEYFCTFCQDMLDSTLGITDDEIGYSTLKSRYFSWRQLFKPDRGKLSEPEIMGLLGELLFLRDFLIPHMGIDLALESWTGPEKTHKDFSFENEWFEIKSITAGKDTVKISSIEQLDSDVSGHLVIYSLEKMSPNFDGIKINQVVQSIIEMLNTSVQKDLFFEKLEINGFDFATDYDSYVYIQTDYFVYYVEKNRFPCLNHEQLPNAISKASYELILNKIEQFKEN